jgi:predicted NAD/FAD-dependent oxidoreductase
VLHASPAWTEAHLEAAPEAVTESLLAAFAALAGRNLPAPEAVQAHRWRYARVTQALGVECLAGADGLVACGDWCLGPRVESAWLSGLAAAEHLLARGDIGASRA